MGRGFVYGGSLANTYWLTSLAWNDDKTVEKRLRLHRLKAIAARFERIADALPPYLADVLGYSLDKWSKVNLESVDKARLKTRLEDQQKVWRDILFGRRDAESYLNFKNRAFIRTCAIFALVMVAMAFIVSVLVAASTVGGVMEKGHFFDEGKTTNWASFFAAVSALILTISGLITRFFSWTVQSRDFVKKKLTQGMILKNTYRDWESCKKPHG